jgi:hypothetical protein
MRLHTSSSPSGGILQGFVEALGILGNVTGAIEPGDRLARAGLVRRLSS